jgi:hypothetical protein
MPSRGLTPYRRSTAIIRCRPAQGTDLGHGPSVERLARVQNNLAGLLIGRRAASHGAFGEGARRAKPVFRAEISRRFLAAKELDFAIHEHRHFWSAGARDLRLGCLRLGCLIHKNNKLNSVQSCDISVQPFARSVVSSQIARDPAACR